MTDEEKYPLIKVVPDELVQIKRRLEAIEIAVSGDFMEDMECKLYLNDGRDKDTFTQEEAQIMVDILLDVFRIAHGGVSSCCLGKHVDLVESYLKVKDTSHTPDQDKVKQPSSKSPADSLKSFQTKTPA